MPLTITGRGEATDDLSLLKLMRLCSPMLPIGSFSWSQGLEAAVDRGWIHNRESAADWLEASLFHSLASTEGPLLLRLHAALLRNDGAAFSRWNELLLALRETSELYQEDIEQGDLLHRLTRLHSPGCPDRLKPYTLPAAFAEALHEAAIPIKEGILGFFYMWVETQVTQIIKLLPLGLRDGQALLDQVLQKIPQALLQSKACADDELGFTLPGRALASCFHESQYCRIYRS